MTIRNTCNSITIENITHININVFGHKDLGNHLLQLCPQAMNHRARARVCVCVYIYIHTQGVLGGMCQTSGECSLR